MSRKLRRAVLLLQILTYRSGHTVPEHHGPVRFVPARRALRVAPIAALRIVSGERIGFGDSHSPLTSPQCLRTPVG